MASRRALPQRPAPRNNFEIAIICPLPVEFDAVSLIFDEFWDDAGDVYGRAVGDVNNYTTGRIGKFNVVLALLQDVGKASAAGVAASLRSSYSGVYMALLVGICGGVPRYKEDVEILLSDVIVSDSVVLYNPGRRYVSGFKRKSTLKDNLGKLNKDLRNLLAKLQTNHG
jgi:nucleoside phosphorylase